MLDYLYLLQQFSQEWALTGLTAFVKKPWGRVVWRQAFTWGLCMAAWRLGCSWAKLWVGTMQWVPLSFCRAFIWPRKKSTLTLKNPPEAQLKIKKASRRRLSRGPNKRLIKRPIKYSTDGFQACAQLGAVCCFEVRASLCQSGSKHFAIQTSSGHPFEQLPTDAHRSGGAPCL